MNVITISRQMGSLGRQVANLTAECLGYRVVWRDLINEAARRAGAPEAALSTIDELGLFGLCPSPKERRAYRQAVDQVMTELAQAGAVILIGRAGQVVLRNRPGVLHVRVIAPAPLRAVRIASQQNISLQAAQAQVEASDRFRKDYLRRFYHVRWDDPELYDLVVNTERMTPEIAAGSIVAALGSRAPAVELSGKGA